MRKLIDSGSLDYDVRKFTGSSYCYNYRQLRMDSGPEEIKKYCDKTKSLFSKVAKQFTDNDNSLWVLRHYLAIKFLISASILSGSAIYSRDRKVYMGVPYYNYYALLNCCRAFLMTCPDVKWNGKESVEMTHSKILNLTGEYMKRLSLAKAKDWHKQLETARDHRELYSYRFPGTGLEFAKGGVSDPDDCANLARLIAELAMLNSECFEASLSKHAPEEMNVPPLEDHHWATAYKVMNVEETDGYDRDRFGKFLSGWGRVSTLEVMTSDGMVEDFYGAWQDAEINDGDFAADDYMRHLLTL